MRYRVFAKSIPGPKYITKGWQCQDSSDILDLGFAQAVAVADGHGSSDCFRSELGSAFAIQVALNQTESFFKTVCEESETPIQFGETGIAYFKYSIWNEWRKAVKEDWANHLKSHAVLGEGEVRFESVSDKYKTRFLSKDEAILEKYLFAAYGTTLLLAIAIESQLLLLQIGDGSCVVLQKNGEFRVPVPPDEENFLNVTVSLCEDAANLKIRHVVLDCDPDSPTTPVAVFLSTDGVDDCYPVYRNEQHLYKLYTIILENILSAGYEATEAEIVENLLPGMTAKSSQDDISLAFLVSEDIDVLREAFEGIHLAYKPRIDIVENPNAEVNQGEDKAADTEEE